jgi:hypothetical protein
VPNPADLLSLQDDEDPDDLLRMQLDQGQGANLAGAPMPPGAPTGMPGQGVAPSPNVPGPLAALAGPSAPGKPRIKMRLLPKGKKPRIKLKSKPKISYSDFMKSIGR